MRTLPRLLFALLLAVLVGPGLDAKEVETFSVDLPPNIAEAASVLLYLQDLRLPKNQPAVVRVWAVDEKNVSEALLGSYGVLADSAEASGMRTVPSVPIEITRNLKDWLSKHREAQKLTLRVRPVDGRGKSLGHIEWGVRGIAIEGK
jgi:hypothetical protein